MARPFKSSSTGGCSSWPTFLWAAGCQPEKRSTPASEPAPNSVPRRPPAIPVPAAMVPTPMIIALSGAGVALNTALQSMVAQRKPPTRMFNAPNT